MEKYEPSISLAAKNWFAFLEKGLDAFLIVAAVVDLAAQRLNALIRFGVKGMRIAEHPQLLFQDAMYQGRSFRDSARKLHGEGLKFVAGDDVVDHAGRPSAGRSWAPR